MCLISAGEVKKVFFFFFLKHIFFGNLQSYNLIQFPWVFRFFFFYSCVNLITAGSLTNYHVSVWVGLLIFHHLAKSTQPHCPGNWAECFPSVIYHPWSHSVFSAQLWQIVRRFCLNWVEFLCALTQTCMTSLSDADSLHCKASKKYSSLT